MLGRIRGMLIKEFIQVFRDKRSRFLLFGPPVIQMLVFGYAATLEIRHIPTAVLDYDNSQVSRDLLSRFTASPYFDVRARVNNRGQIGDLIDRGDVTVALQINAGFAQDLRKGQTAHLQLIVDSSNSNTALDRGGIRQSDCRAVRAGVSTRAALQPHPRWSSLKSPRSCWIGVPGLTPTSTVNGSLCRV